MTRREHATSERNSAYQPLLFSSDGGAIALNAVRSPVRATNNRRQLV